MPRTELVGHHAIWWRSSVKREGDKLIPTAPFHPYDPFQYYWPHGRAGRVERSLPYRFLDVDSEDPAEILSFTERFGVLGDANKTGWSSLSKDADKALLKKALGRVLKELPSEMKDSMVQGFESVVSARMLGARVQPSLCEPMTTEAFAGSQDQFRVIVENLDDGRANTHDINGRLSDIRQNRKEDFIELSPDAISNFVSGKLSAVRPRATWNPQNLQWETSWDIGSLESAMYLMLLFDMQGRGHILKCPWCNAVFLGDHPRTEYCSQRCQNSAKVARHRANKLAGTEGAHKRLKENKHGKTRRQG